MSGPSTYEPKTGLTKWLDTRLPIVRLAYDSFVDFPTPKNLNYWWTFGGILAVCLVTQIITGIILAMYYVPHVDYAFDSVERIMRDVEFGWLIRYIHAVGASMFFLAVYIHMARGLYYGSYKAPREVLWILGVVIYLLMIITAFLGYVLPWGQMSYWGAMVITNLLGAFPLVGESITHWLWGGFTVDNPTLNRFFSLHYLMPFVIFGIVILHIWALHVPGNNNPTGVDVKSKADTVPFHPYYTVKDGFAIVAFLLIFAAFVFYAPGALGHTDNYIPANPLVTPAHIVPEWYLLPFYAILRAVPDKLGGVLLMFAAIFVLFVLPWLDTSKIRSMRYRPLARQFYVLFIIGFLGLGWVGAENPDDPVIKLGNPSWEVTTTVGGTVSTTPFAEWEEATAYVAEQPASSSAFLSEVPAPAFTFLWLGRILTVFYFAYFLLILPILGLIERPKAIPDSIAGNVLGGTPAGAAASPDRQA
jgi:ubiquinol-cytochrome c reductase cytochrome b subunit